VRRPDRPPPDRSKTGKPDVVDLRRYREARTKAARKPAPPPLQQTGAQPILGGRKNAGLILIAVLLLFLALTVGPRLL
jgi:hypothetical protein